LFKAEGEEMTDVEKRIRELEAENLALSIIVGNVLSKLARNPSLRRAIIEGFDQSANVAESVSLTKFGESAAPKHVVEALRIIEETRVMILGNESQPDDPV
jgi:hypothetical protein